MKIIFEKQKKEEVIIRSSYGEWGGRYVLYQSYAETHPIWANAEGCQDTVVADNGQEYTSAQATIWRWCEAYKPGFHGFLGIALKCPAVFSLLH